MSKLVIFPFKHTSEGAILLRETLRTRFVDVGSRLTADDVVINWGCGWAVTPGRKVLNKRDAINRAINKLAAFDFFEEHGVPCPEYTTSRSLATYWLVRGNTIYARETAEGENGRGIKIYQPGDTIEREYCFYSKAFPTAREFRVNCAFGNAIDVCEKKRRNGTRPNPLMRVGDDWVYCREDLDVYPASVKEAAVGAVKALGLDFGGVDVGLSSDNQVCVFEVNTAPWLGTIIARKYANAFEQYVLGDRQWEEDRV